MLKFQPTHSHSHSHSSLPRSPPPRLLSSKKPLPPFCSNYSEILCESCWKLVEEAISQVLASKAHGNCVAKVEEARVTFKRKVRENQSPVQEASPRARFNSISPSKDVGSRRNERIREKQDSGACH